MKERLSVVGLGKLGLCLAVCFAEKGYITLGIDCADRVVDLVNEGKEPFFEPGLAELIQKNINKTLVASKSYKKAIDDTDITFVLVGTPSDQEGNFSNQQIEEALKSLSREFGESDKDYHLFVISSTVMPGSIESRFIPIIEEYSKKKLYTNFDVCYDPDFVALGKVIHDFFNPDLVVIGETSASAGLKIENIHNTICDKKPVVSHMSIINGELSKVVLNVYITLKISFANMISNLCDSIPGSDVDVITKSIGNDKRIAPYYLQGGLAFGGTCFPRDIRAFKIISDKNNILSSLVRAIEETNQHQHHILLKAVEDYMNIAQTDTLGILGLSFTKNTPVITESPSIILIENLLKKNKKIFVFDHLAIDNTKKVFGNKIHYCGSYEECLSEVKCVVLALRSSEIKMIVERFKPSSKLYLIDCWRLIDRKQLSNFYVYKALGNNMMNGS